MATDKGLLTYKVIPLRKGVGGWIGGLGRTDEEGKGGVTDAPTDARNISTYFAEHDG